MDLVIVRGLPGSGKTTFAKLLADNGYRHYEADMFFEDNGEYVFDPAKLAAAHRWCLNKVVDDLMYGRDVVVANTFSRRWEMEPYIEQAKKFGFNYHILTMQGNWGNIHKVPEETIQRMKARWEN